MRGKGAPRRGGAVKGEQRVTGMEKRIYLDHAATTPLDPRVLQVMLPYFTQKAGNANSLHAFGREAVAAADAARDKVAACIGAKPSEIYFTSGGSESDNWAMIGAAEASAAKGRHIIVSAIEHPAVLGAAQSLQARGFSVTYAPVGADGIVDTAALERAVRPDTVLVGVMTANNEVGTVQPVEEIAAMCRERGILFFTDAVQAAGVLPLCTGAGGADLIALSAHKFYGPKGVGALYIRSGVKIGRLIAGGHQERGMRGGTTNVPGIVGMAEALALSLAEAERENAYVRSLRDLFIRRVQGEIPYVRLNGHPLLRLPSNAHFSFEYTDGESVLYSLDLKGIAASAGSACTSGSPEPSHVLAAMGTGDALARGGVRFTFGKDNTEQEVNAAVDALKEIVVRLRARSPRFPKNLKNEVFPRS